MPQSFRHRDIIAINEFSKNDILHILEQTDLIKQQPKPQLLQGRILGSCFFEPSTRTRLSFDAAMQRLGGSVIGFSDIQSTSQRKKESLTDTIKMIESYVDVLVIRHPLEGSARLAADKAAIPVINAGDGSHQHPTQTFLDLFTIKECQGRLEGLNIAIAGDLKHGRTAHSLAEALTHFNPRLYLISPSALEMPKEVCEELRNKRIKFSFHHTFEEVVDKLDILYMTRVQEERFLYEMEFEKVKNSLLLKKEHLNNVRENFKILHPLPRVNEVDERIDSTPHAYYFSQAQNGIYVRQALLALLLGELTT